MIRSVFFGTSFLHKNVQSICFILDILVDLDVLGPEISVLKGKQVDIFFFPLYFISE